MDPTLLQLILRILINNAVKFSEARAQVDVVGRLFQGVYVLEVVDTGLGISLAQREKLFSIGIRAQRGTNSEIGAGLGLVLARQFADRMGITLDFVPKSSPGCTFALRIPMHTLAN